MGHTACVMDDKNIKKFIFPSIQSNTDIAGIISRYPAIVYDFWVYNTCVFVLREAAKKVLYLVAWPLRGGGGLGLRKSSI